MRVDNRRLSAVVAAVLMTGGCRQSTPRSAGVDSARPAARADSTSAGPGPGITRADSVILRTDKSSYRAGEAMTLTLENNGAARYTFNPCTRTIERADGNAWKAIDESGRMCTMEAWLLDAHATRTGPTEVPRALAPGRYRVVVRMTVDGGTRAGAAVDAVSDPITVS